MPNPLVLHPTFLPALKKHWKVTSYPIQDGEWGISNERWEWSFQIQRVKHDLWSVPWKCFELVPPRYALTINVGFSALHCRCHEAHWFGIWLRWCKGLLIFSPSVFAHSQAAVLPSACGSRLASNAGCTPTRTESKGYFRVASSGFSSVSWCSPEQLSLLLTKRVRARQN